MHSKKAQNGVVSLLQEAIHRKTGSCTCSYGDGKCLCHCTV